MGRSKADIGFGTARCLPHLMAFMCCLYISLRIVGLPQQIVYAHLVVIRQLHQQFVRQWLCTRFDIAVFPLGNADRIRDLLLGQVGIISQILDPVFQ